MEAELAKLDDTDGFNVVSLTEKVANRRLGSDELNIAEFPLCSTGRDSASAEKTLFFRDKIYDESTKTYVDRELIITASDHFGLPTPVDSDVLLVLMYLSNQKNNFSDPVLRFSRFEIVSLLGWNHSGASYRRIDESLNRWMTVTLHYKRSWWSKHDRSWQNKAFHILESIDLQGRSANGGTEQSTLTWNSVIMKSVKSNYVKRLDLEIYFQLTSPAARQAYRFLDKRFYRSRVLEFDLRSFACEHVGLSRNYDIGQLKERLRKCLHELESVGFLKPATKDERFQKVKVGQWKIKLTRAGQSDINNIEPERSLLEAKLTERGISKQSIDELLASHTEQEIASKIAYVDWLSKQPGKAPHNPSAFLVSAIRDNYVVPDSFAKDTRKPTKKSTPRRPKPATTNDEENDSKLTEFLDSLSQPEREAFEEKALTDGNRFVLDTYQRLIAKNDERAKYIRWSLIRDYFNKRTSRGPATIKKDDDSQQLS